MRIRIEKNTVKYKEGKKEKKKYKYEIKIKGRNVLLND